MGACRKDKKRMRTYMWERTGRGVERTTGDGWGKGEGQIDCRRENRERERE